mmetsp:Transcript_15078/g.45656  ORF Transcript_15078/g.45656 Transcript_15078/m.45656 type:complete len:329 (-) Transcript_15078:148-1134(-)
MSLYMVSFSEKITNEEDGGRSGAESERQHAMMQIYYFKSMEREELSAKTTKDGRGVAVGRGKPADGTLKTCWSCGRGEGVTFSAARCSSCSIASPFLVFLVRRPTRMLATLASSLFFRAAADVVVALRRILTGELCAEEDTDVESKESRCDEDDVGDVGDSALLFNRCQRAMRRFRARTASGWTESSPDMTFFRVSMVSSRRRWRSRARFFSRISSRCRSCSLCCSSSALAMPAPPKLAIVVIALILWSTIFFPPGQSSFVANLRCVVTMVSPSLTATSGSWSTAVSAWLVSSDTPSFLSRSRSLEPPREWKSGLKWPPNAEKGSPAG